MPHWRVPTTLTGRISLFLGLLAKATVTIEHANHLFEMKTTLVGDAIEELLADFTVRT